jgi:formiminoglutamase
VSLLNWDAHPDVRELNDGRGHSGSPFRQALEHPSGLARGYTVAGLLPHAASAAHVAYVRGRGRGRVLFRDELSGTAVRELYSLLEAPALVSFDLDALDQSAAPGVSAPAVGGLGAEEWLRIAGAAGACPAVGSADVVELSPTYDIDGRTARLAALTVWHLLRGLARRPG